MIEAAEIAKRLGEVGVDAKACLYHGKVCVPSATAVTLLDSLLSATGTEQATALVTRLADTPPDTYNDSEFCYFCGRLPSNPWGAHQNDCLWQLAQKWKEEWA